MCFSAGASFTSGVILSAVSVATARKVTHPSHRLFASIPAFFAFQQFAEGILWLTLRSGGSDRLQASTTYIFLLMALVIWPSVIPLAMLKLEETRKRRFALKIILSAGIVLSAYYLFCLFFFRVEPVINGFHIQYVNDFPKTLGYVAFGIYAIATIAPLFVSSVRKMYMFGLLILVSCFVTGVFYKEYLTSVWCFFAAMISIVIYYIVSTVPTTVTSDELSVQGNS
ncbi:MAG: DUF6629 family protein [Bacteroidales bacterium]